MSRPPFPYQADRHGAFLPAARAAGVLLLALMLSGPARAADRDAPPASTDSPRAMALGGASLSPTATAVVNFADLARQEASGQVPRIAVRPRPVNNNESGDEGEEPGAGRLPLTPSAIAPPFVPFATSPPPTQTFIGLDDIAMVDSSYIVIPPDVSGAVGPTKVMQGCNNNYRVLDKSTGAVINTVGTATFWAPVVAMNERASLTDPRMAYDPYANRWLAAMQTYTTGAGKLLVAVSLTSDPNGAWYLYNFNTGYTIDYPILGFNKNWISVSVNRYSNIGLFQRGINLVVNYPLAQGGTGTGTIFTLPSNSGFCASPCLTYSNTSDTLYAVTHLSSGGATYTLDWITGTAAAPVYNIGGATLTRTGGGWVQASGNALPQSAPTAGASSCAGAPCPIEAQDSQIRSSPVYRGGRIYYAQTVGLPSGTMTHTGVQWTKIAAPGGAFVDGGRLEDPTATTTNGGKWYDNTHVAVNAAGDFLLGFSQFSSAQHPGAGYAVHLAADAAGTIRDAQIYKAGDDYYHKTFSTTTGRNRWGDFSTAQVDPVDDASFWTVQEYAKTRPGTDDGNAGSNSSRWSTYWAKVSTSTSFTLTASAGANGSIAPNGAVVVAAGATQSFTLTPAATYHVADVLVDGVSVGAVTSYTFTNVTADHTIAATFALNTFTITASAGANGSIAPSGAVVVNAGATQNFIISAAPGSHILDVLVDGLSVGAVSSYAFSNVTAPHTIAASFAVNVFTITASTGPNGSLSPSGAVPVNSGATQAFTIVATVGHYIADVLVDGVSVGAVGSYTFTNVYEPTAPTLTPSTSTSAMW